MRSSFALSSLAAVGLVTSACARSLGPDPVVVPIEAKSSVSTEERPTMEVAPPVLADAALAAPTRPRLSRTVTLGEGTTEPVYTPAARPPQATGQAGSGVVVNNNITVNSAPPIGYGSYGGYRGYAGRASTGGGYARDGFGTRVPWAATGWEGAGRTAAPGHTPGVGGNWSPPPSFGPRQMR